MMQIRKMVMAQIASSGLPSEYQRVEYIAGTGTQYINSGIECTSDLCVEYGFYYETTTNSAICGGIDTSYGGSKYFRHHCTPLGPSSGGYWLQYSSSNVASIPLSAAMNVKHDIAVDPVNGVAMFNGNQITFDALPSGLTTGKPYGILARISDTGAIQAKASRFYYFKFKRNGTLIGDFIPCYRKSDGVIGMYDLVTKTFFTNAGTGTFSKGNDI